MERVNTALGCLCELRNDHGLHPTAKRHWCGTAALGIGEMKKESTGEQQEMHMQASIWRGVGGRLSGAMLVVAALSLWHAAAIFANPVVPGPTAQIPSVASNNEASPANVVTSPDFRLLMKIMRRNIVMCGVPRTAVLHWHVTAEGIIDNFVLNKPSGDVCFDQIVILNADAVVKAKLRATAATRFGIAEAAWVPFAVAARD
jgi:hypothetical protein